MAPKRKLSTTNTVQQARLETIRRMKFHMRSFSNCVARGQVFVVTDRYTDALSRWSPNGTCINRTELMKHLFHVLSWVGLSERPRANVLSVLEKYLQVYRSKCAGEIDGRLQVAFRVVKRTAREHLKFTANAIECRGHLLRILKLLGVSEKRTQLPRRFASANSVPRPTPRQFYGFMAKRERARILRERSANECYGGSREDSVMRQIRLTNVKREDDYTSRVVRALTSAVTLLWRQLAHGGKAARDVTAQNVGAWDSWSDGQREIAGLLVFNAGLWRCFGTCAFIINVGVVTSWVDAVIKIAQVSRNLWSRHIHCFTDAYSRARWGSERRAITTQMWASMERLIDAECGALKNLWAKRQDIAEIAGRSRSWRQTVECIRRLPGFDGVGFMAKEIVQDLLSTPLFRDWCSPGGWRCKCVDVLTWSAIGSGARRGLNRLHGRHLHWGVADGSDSMQDDFLRELLEVFEARHIHWPKQVEGEDAPDLEVHDVQFQLCEFDKFLRALHRQGPTRVYRCRTTDCSNHGLAVAVSEVVNSIGKWAHESCLQWDSWTEQHQDLFQRFCQDVHSALVRANSQPEARRGDSIDAINALLLEAGGEISWKALVDNCLLPPAFHRQDRICKAQANRILAEIPAWCTSVTDDRVSLPLLGMRANPLWSLGDPTRC